MKNFLLILSMAALFFLSAAAAFSATAFAAGAVSDPSSSLPDLLQALVNAFSSGHDALGGALLTIGLAAIAKRYLGDSFPFLHTNAGGTLLALVTASATAAAASLGAPGAQMTLDLLRSSLMVGIAAAGGFAVLKNVVVEPLLAPYLKKASPFVQSIGNWVMWIFDHSTPAAPDPLSSHTPISPGDVAVVTVTTVTPASPVAPKDVRDAHEAGSPVPGAEPVAKAAPNPNAAPAAGASSTQESK